ncbi:aminodeoxychorismate/anthranilate synthase component II [Clostridium sp. OS1-26]|uniref:anthranilate synthase component II n=1 Tax=Clostridium sp. OS1-26 TaxID=3070681 RepID=UPI0027E196AD|nr:aminodeoxychorismate/anthranilate synthase component II [Clostridium sp. OS1-26]WML34917.1 aminodeoxychorismate/anthranilate synthase component II [Clostridium sp. OS1-26]
MIFIIDNYDSFTFNLYQYIGEIYDNVKVIRNDEIDIETLKNLQPQGIILSPGPGIPEDAGICIDVIRKLGSSIPILGICLGHQAIGSAYGGKVVRAENIKHGKTSHITAKENKLFKGIERLIRVMRYHSLIIDRNTLPEDIKIIAESIDDNVIMGIKHRDHEVYGLQFHPESILTEQGKVIIKNFVEGICNASGSN